MFAYFVRICKAIKHFLWWVVRVSLRTLYKDTHKTNTIHTQCADAKIPPDGSSGSTYARAGEIWFALLYRTRSALVWCAWSASQFDRQLTRRLDVKFKELSARQSILHQQSAIRQPIQGSKLRLGVACEQHLDPNPIVYDREITKGADREQI